MIVASYSSTETLLDLLGKATGQVIRKESTVHQYKASFVVAAFLNGTRIALDTFSEAAPAINAAKAYV